MNARVALSRVFVCQCGRPIFFRNSACVSCGTPLGYDPEQGTVLPLQQGSQVDTWQPFGQPQGTEYARCANFASAAACNWLLEAPQAGAMSSLCRSCRLNRTIPDLSQDESAALWGRVEFAKRRLVSSLIGLGLPVRSRVSEDTVQGLAFDLVRSLPGGARIVTGHEDGIVTIDVDEADDAKRERLRAALQEPYRTVLGHLRHEVGHYYWWRLVEDSAWLAPFRSVFGDERVDYQGALARHYAEGPAADWQLAHVSAYASSHPWEDWAETWAHYLHMVDTLDTAMSFGLDAHITDLRYEPFVSEALYDPGAEGATDFLHFVNEWIELTGVLNELARSMGQPDTYPFVMTAAALAKLQFVDLVAKGRSPPRRGKRRKTATAGSPTPAS